MNSLWLAGLLALLAASRSGPGPEARRGQARVDEHPGRGVPAHPRRPPRHLPHQGAGRPEGRIRVLRQQAVCREEGRGRLLDRDHGPRGAGLPLLPDVHRRRAGERPREPDVLRHRQGHQRDRDPGEGRRLLPAEGRAARRGPRALVLLEDDPGLAAHLRLHPARLRRRSRDAVSRPLPPARRRRGRDRLAEPGAHELHHGQPDRREEGEADARGHGAGLRASARRDGPRARPAPSGRPGPGSPAASGHQPHVHARSRT